MAKELKIIIGKDGNSKVEANGFSGGGCSKVVEELILAVGGEETSDNKKPEYYNPDGDNFNELSIDR